MSDYNAEITALGQTFGGVARTDSKTTLFVVLSATGAVAAPGASLPSVLGNDFGWSGIAATKSAYYVSTKVGTSNNVGVARYGADGALQGPVVSVASKEAPAQALLIGASDRTLVTWLDGLSLMAAVLKDGQAAASPPQLVGNASCCTERAWSAVSHSGGFAVLRADKNAFPYLRFRNVDPEGALGAEKPLPELDGIFPHWGAALGANLAFGHCQQFAVLSPSGAIVSTGQLPASESSACAIGSTGNHLRMADPKATAIEWRDVTPGAPSGVMLTIPNAHAAQVKMAWDGSGFGLIWRDNFGDLRFARVKVCSI